MNVFRYLGKKIKLFFYNKKNSTSVNSIDADLRARYGKNVRVDKGCIVASDVEIGDYSYVNSGSSLENCSIGKFVSISSGVYISPWEHPLYGLTTHPIGYSQKFINRKRNRTVIGNDVLISLNVIILEGVTIGDGAVIGAGAVVKHNVEPYEVVGGIPARHIRFRFDDETRRKIKKLEWWDLDKDSIIELIKRFENSNKTKGL